MALTPPARVDLVALLHHPRHGDDEAFRRLVEPHWPELHAHCYRMLGSVHDADDALQDALVRAWRGLARFDAQRPLRPWLYKIATNACLDTIGKRSKRGLPPEHSRPSVRTGRHPGPQAESTWIEPYPDERPGLTEGYASPEARYEQREAIELAFIAALQHLPARQRAVLILREVLGFSAAEVAETLDTTAASVNSALQRARKTVEAKLPDRTQQVTMRSLTDQQLRDIVRRFIDAFQSGDVHAIVAMLTEDATFAMPPYPGRCRGHDAISDSWLIPDRPRTLRYSRARANGQLAFGVYQLDLRAGAYVPAALDVLTLEGTRISAITAFRTPPSFELFGLPRSLPSDREQ